MANAMEALGQHMEQKPRDELAASLIVAIHKRALEKCPAGGGRGTLERQQFKAKRAGNRVEPLALRFSIEIKLYLELNFKHREKPSTASMLEGYSQACQIP